jgi:enoyl-CoA hydratase/carnithine racemase
LSYGLASEVVPEAELDATVENICEMILKAPRIATEAVKDYMRSGTRYGNRRRGRLRAQLHATINASIERG